MKKILALILIIASCFSLSLSLASCGGENNDNANYEKMLQGLKFELTEDKTGYEVATYRLESPTEIIIPETYKDLPVKESESTLLKIKLKSQRS